MNEGITKATEQKQAITVQEAVAAAPVATGLQPNRSQVSRIRVAHEPKVEKTEELQDGDEEFFKPVVSTRAEIVPKYAEEEDPSPSVEGQGEKEAESDPAKADKLEKKVPKKFEGKSAEEVIASYTELESLTTKLAQRNAELEKGTAKPEKQPEADNQSKIEITEELVEKFYSKPKEALEDLLKLATSVAERAVVSKKQEDVKKSAEQDRADTVSWVQKNRPDLLTDTHAAMLDGIAAVTPGATFMERYTKAIEQFDQTMGNVAAKTEKETKKQMADVTKEKQSATLPSGSAADHGKGGKIWRRSELDRLITKDPASYARQQKSIAKALQEGRVRED